MKEQLRSAPALQVFDRETGKLVEEGVFAGGFLFWSYNSRIGLALTDLVLKRRFVTEWFGLYFRTKRSKKSIESLVRTGAVRLDELTQSLDEFHSFNEFFTRTIDLTRRPIDHRPEVFAAPADGRALAYPSVSPNQTWRIKRATFQLSSLIGDPGLTERYSGGAMVILRLHMADYHHFHFPDSGVPEAAVAIPGSYYSVSPYPQRRLIPFYGENRRMRTLFHTDHFGDVLLIEIGGFAVGSIQQRYEPGRRVERGAEKGYFQFGGSTIVVVFEPGVMQLDEDLLARTEQDVETLVRLDVARPAQIIDRLGPDAPFDRLRANAPDSRTARSRGRDRVARAAASDTPRHVTRKRTAGTPAASTKARVRGPAGSPGPGLALDPGRSSLAPDP